MATVHGKRAFRFFNTGAGRSDDACLKPAMRCGDFALQVTTSTGRYYMRFVSHETFYTWMKTIPEENRTFSELIPNGGQKFRMDIDEKPDDIRGLVDTTKKMLERIGFKSPSLLVFDIETSYHVVLTNYFFASHDRCKAIAVYLSSKIRGMDLGVYGRTQHFRLEGCTKYGQRRWKVRMDSDTSRDNYHEGVITSSRGTKIGDITLPVPRLSRDKIVGMSSGVDISTYPEFVVRRSEGDLIILDRVVPSYCNACGRSHDHDGAYILRGRLFCRRGTQ